MPISLQHPQLLGTGLRFVLCLEDKFSLLAATFSQPFPMRKVRLYIEILISLIESCAADLFSLFHLLDCYL